MGQTCLDPGQERGVFLVRTIGARYLIGCTRSPEGVVGVIRVGNDGSAFAGIVTLNDCDEHHGSELVITVGARLCFRERYASRSLVHSTTVKGITKVRDGSMVDGVIVIPASHTLFPYTVAGGAKLRG